MKKRSGKIGFVRVMAWVIGSCCLLVLAPDCLFAQTSPGISGQVHSDVGSVVGGATIVLYNQDSSFHRQMVADEAGRFSFYNIPQDHYNIRARFVGFKAAIVSDIPFSADSTLHVEIVLSAENNSLDEVVVVGYGKQKKANLTGAVAQVSGKVLEDRSLPNISQGLQGMVPNLNLVPQDGKPTQSPSFNIRGNTSIGQGGSALVLIDGVQGDPSLLNPNDVASVTVLKDAASSAIYGARAAYGVVLITTKTPKKDKVSINYSADYASKRPTVVPDIVDNGYTYATMFDSAWSAWNDYAQTAQNINKTQPFSKAYLEEYKKRNADPSLSKVETDQNGNYVYYGNTNWYDLLYKDHLGATSQNLSISGSSEKTSFYLTGRYYGQGGLFRYNSDDYHLYNLTGKGTVQVLPWLQITDNFQFSSRYYHNPLNVGEGGSIWRNLADEGHPSSMLFNPDGTLTFSAAYTVGDFVYGKNGIDMTKTVIRNTSGFVAAFLNNQLHIHGDLTFENTREDQKQIRVRVPYSTTEGVIAYVGTAYNDLNQDQYKTDYLATNIYADYETHLGDHYLKAMVGYNYEQSVYNAFSAGRNGLIYADATDLNLALGQSISTGGGYEKWAILGGFYRLNYSYKDRYLLELDGRYDGSSKFPSDQQFAFFPSASAGWRLSKEAFWHISPKAISDLKIRASYCSLGNGNIASYNYQERFNISQSGRVIDGVLGQYTSAPGVIPAGLTWETATTADLGLDGTLLSNRLNITGDIYTRKTTNMFTVGQTLPAVFGATVPKGNYADMTTKGWEVSITWADAFKLHDRPFGYSIGVWMSDYIAKIDKYNNETRKLSDYYAGETVGEIWGYVNDGYWTEDNVGDAKAAQALFKASNSGTWLPGDIKFKDLNGDGVINNGDNTVDNPGDMKVIGNSTPRYNFGITFSADYAGFYASLFFQGVLKQDWWPGSEADLFWGQYNRPYNYAFKSQLDDIWSASNPNAYFPRYRGYVAQNGSGELHATQSKYLQNVRYIRLKNAQIGYNLPKDWMKRMHIQSAKIYLSGENLWTVSPLYKYTKAMDVEGIHGSDRVLTSGTSGNGNNYPILQSLTIGISVNF